MAEGRLRLAPIVQKFIDEVKIMAKYVVDAWKNIKINPRRILLSELDTHQVPFDGLLTDFGDVMAPMAIVMKVMQNQIKVAPTPTCPASVVALMERCTQYEAKLRPTAIQVLETLRSIHCELAAEKIV
ncbi:unnamed protein product [Aphanomyces euteiches]